MRTLVLTLLIFSFQPSYGISPYLSIAVSSGMFKDDSVKTEKPVAFAPYGLVNIFNNPVIACQVAAIGNIARERSSGFQCGGIFNTAVEHKGFQLAGIINTSGKASGIQIGGIINHAHDGNSVQIAGLINNSHSDTINESERQPMQISGLVNNSDGARVQITGIANNCPSPTELQIAGIINRCDDKTGTQIAGIANYCGESHGIQVAGIVNRCSYFRGAQIGLVNISDSCDGVAIGLINIVKTNGYIKLELSGDEMSCANIGFRSGTRKIHGIVSVGLKPEHIAHPVWNYGIGVGTLIPVGNRTALGIDVMHHQVFYGHHSGENYVSRLNVGIDQVITQRISLYSGVTLNLLYTFIDDSSFEETYGSIEPYHFGEFRLFNNDVKPWVGIKLGLRFF